MENKEEWKLVDGTDDYFISSRGRFKHNKKLLKTKPDKDGYCICNLGKLKKRVHRLVAQAFIPNPDNLPVVDHIDGNKKNNCVENLRWVTQQENIQAAYDNGLNIGNTKVMTLAIDPNENGELYSTQVEASRATGIPTPAINKVCRGIISQRNGWKFVKLKSFTDKRNDKIKEE